MTSKLGVLDFHPIQYHVPLYQRLVSRANVDLDVLYLSDHGYRAVTDPLFRVTVAWDIDLLSGYANGFLTTAEKDMKAASRLRTLRQWIVRHDAVVIHGYSEQWMLLATAICRFHKIPYLMRGDSQPDGHSTGIRRTLRRAIARIVVSGSAGCLAIGKLNEQFYRQHGASHITFAPYSVDDERFARLPDVGRSEVLARWGLNNDRPVIMYCGKLYPGKRPLDLSAAVKSLPQQATVLFVGDGILADQVRASLRRGDGVVTGFVNQSELPSYYHAADILVLPSEVENWGLVVNEAMAAGVLPVVSHRVGAASDLVDGVGEIYQCGDVEGLTTALVHALARVRDPRSRDRIQQHVARYSLDRTAIGFEEAALRALRG